MMPALSNFISYRPGRKNKPLKPPPQIRHTRNLSSSSHPYAYPPIIDINDGATSNQAFNEVNADEKDMPESPRMKLDLEFNDEPLGDLFPLNFLKPDSPEFRASQQATGPGENEGQRLVVDENVRYTVEEENTSTDDEEDGEEDVSSSEAVLASLEAMDATAFINVRGTGDNNHPTLVSTPWRKVAPAPIKIPGYGVNTPMGRSRAPSRPISQISSVESSAISGTTLARALIANTFVLSGDPRGSRYRSGVSLARADSATLPRGEFAYLHSPYWRERTNSGGSMTLSPSALTPSVPPVPDNAELVYVPPKAPRLPSEPRPKHHASVPDNVSSEPGSNSGMTALMGNGDVQTSRRVSRILKQRTPTPPPAQHPSDAPPHHDHDVPEAAPRVISDRSSSPSLPVVDPRDSTPSPRRLSLDKRESDNISEPIVSPVISEAPSSAQDIDTVLDYYSLEEGSPEQMMQGFRPAFSPIREESSSQLSSASIYRDSKRTPSTGRSYSTSPFGAGVRVEWGLHQRHGSDRTSQSPRDGTAKSLLPIGERPRSVQVSPTSLGLSYTIPRPKPPSRSSSVTAITAFDYGEEHVGPPSISTIINHQRSGSTPSPIQVIRDAHDTKTYNITGTPPTEGSEASMSSTGGDVMQTFPETPSAVSPVFTPAGVSSPGMAPEVPMSPFLPQKAGVIQPSLAQQVLLTRAASSVHGARPHSRQSLARTNRTAELSHSQQTLSVVEEPYGDEDSNMTDPTGSSASIDPPTISTSDRASDGEAQAARLATSANVTPVIPTGEMAVVHPLPAGQEISLFQQTTVATPLDPGTPPSVPSLGSLARSVSHMQSTDSLRSRTKGLPRIPPSPKILPPAPPQQGNPAKTGTDATSSAALSGPVPDVLNPSLTHRTEPEWSTPRHPDPVMFATSAVIPVAGTSEVQPQSLPARHRLLASPPLQQPQASTSNSLGYHSRSDSIDSPPPYDTVVSSTMEDPTPSTSGPTPSTAGSSPNRNRFYSSHSASPNTVEFSRNDTMIPSGQSSPNNQTRGPRARPSRPPLPAGPRRPSQTNTVLPTIRSRGESVSSTTSTLPSGGSRRLNLGALPSIKFQTSPIKWKGFTLDAAKWTFTSAQLQEIVSRAIRQSAEPSSIRLLRLETLDDEIPPEVERLQVQRSDVQLKYKTLARRRANLLEALAIHVDGSTEGTSVALRLVDDLKDVSASLDKLTEELHNTDEQLAQLSQLRLAHSSSALAMALRKLNSSLLNQFAEAQVLRTQLESLEAERDEAWKHAEELAIEYEELRSGKAGNLKTENRFGRVLASRKSSLRASKAGLRLSGRHHSHRSSISSNRGYGGHSPLSSRPPEDIPPVPPIPRRRPMHIHTDIPMRSSMGLSMSTSELTPSSGTRALARAQEELCDLLGITLDDTRPRRSRSVGPGQSLQVPSSKNSQSETPNSGRRNSERRASLLGSTQPDAYSALTADVSIMLTADRTGWI